MGVKVKYSYQNHFMDDNFSKWDALGCCRQSFTLLPDGVVPGSNSQTNKIHDEYFSSSPLPMLHTCQRGEPDSSNVFKIRNQVPWISFSAIKAKQQGTISMINLSVN